MKKDRSEEARKRICGKTNKSSLYFRFHASSHHCIHFCNLTLTILLACAALVGCVTTAPTRYYTLTPVTSAANGGDRTSGHKEPCVAISTLEIPDYLDRPYIMTRDSRNGMDYSVFDRWAGSLQEDVVRVLAENLSAQLAGVTVLTGRRAYPVDYWMKISIRRFDPVRGEQVQLSAIWSVLAKDGRELLVRQESFLTEPVKGQDYGAIVSAMSRILGSLGEQMAARLRPIVAR